jgi:type IV pilus assembly protein PilA
MQQQKGFSLIELMIVVFIVGIMAVVAIPIMRGRIDSAKWSEGRAGAAGIRSAARAFCARRDATWPGIWTNVTLTDLGFNVINGADGDDLDGRYFTSESYAIAFTGFNAYKITVSAASSLRVQKPATPSVITLDQDGLWTETP